MDELSFDLTSLDTSRSRHVTGNILDLLMNKDLCAWIIISNSKLEYLVFSTVLSFEIFYRSCKIVTYRKKQKHVFTGKSDVFYYDSSVLTINKWQLQLLMTLLKKSLFQSISFENSNICKTAIGT